MKITIVLWASMIIGIMNQEKSVEVTAQEPIKASDISIDIILLGWQTIKYNIYSNGKSFPDNIPDSTNLYVLQMSYKDTLLYSQPFHNENNILYNKTLLSFDFFSHNDNIYCSIQSSYSDLNQKVLMRDPQTDYKELMTFYRKIKGDD